MNYNSLIQSGEEGALIKNIAGKHIKDAAAKICISNQFLLGKALYKNEVYPRADLLNKRRGVLCKGPFTEVYPRADILKKRRCIKCIGMAYL